MLVCGSQFPFEIHCQENRFHAPSVKFFGSCGLCMNFCIIEVLEPSSVLLRSVSRYSFVEFPKFRKQLDVLSEYEAQNGAFWGYVVLTPTSVFCCGVLSLQNLKCAFCFAFHVQKWNTVSWNFVIMFGPIRKSFSFALFSEWKHSLEALPCYLCSYQGCYFFFKKSRRIFF